MFRRLLFCMRLSQKFFDSPKGAAVSNEFFHRFLELFHGFGVAVFDGMGDAVRHVFVDDGLAEAAERGIDRGKLHQDVRAVLVIFHHDFDMVRRSKTFFNSTLGGIWI